MKKTAKKATATEKKTEEKAEKAEKAEKVEKTEKAEKVNALPLGSMVLISPVIYQRPSPSLHHESLPLTNC